MAIVNSNNYRVAIVKESSFGVINKTLTLAGGALFFNDKLDWNNQPITQELSKKENSLYKAADRTKITGNYATGTLTGELKNTHEILLKAHFDDETQPYNHAVHLGTPLTYNVYQLYLDSTGACTHYDVLLGVTIPSLTLSGEANGILQYTAQLDAASYLQMQPNSSGTALTFTSGTAVPSATSGSQFLFGNVTANTMAFGETKLNSFSLEMTKTLVDNAIRFQNTMTKNSTTGDAYTQVGGTLSYTALWDGIKNAADQSKRYDGTGMTNTFSLVAPTVATWAIVCKGIVTDATRPDADRGLFLGNYTFDLCQISTAAPVVITVS